MVRCGWSAGVRGKVGLSAHGTAAAAAVAAAAAAAVVAAAAAAAASSAGADVYGGCFSCWIHGSRESSAL